MIVAGAAVAGPARADAPAIQGWWTAASGSSTGLPAGPGAPDVPSGGLVVESDASTSGPFAFAALSFDTAPPAGSAATLMLAVAPNSATTPNPSLEICSLDSPSFEPADGGDMSQAPKYDCGKSVIAAVSSDGKTFKFDLASLLNGSEVAVAVLPAGPVERVVLSQPDTGALNVVGRTASGSAGPSPGIGATGSPSPAPSSGASGVPPAPIHSTANPPGDTPGVLPIQSPIPGLETGVAASRAASPSIASPLSPLLTGNVPTSQASPSALAYAPSSRATAIGAASPARSTSAAPLVALIAVGAVVLAGVLWGFAGFAAAVGPADPSTTAKIRDSEG